MTHHPFTLPCKSLNFFFFFFFFNRFFKSIPAKAKLHFLQPFLQSSVSHDPSEIILLLTWCSIVLLNVFVETDTFIQDFLIKFKSNIINYFWLRLINASLWNKIINLFLNKIFLTPNFWTVVYVKYFSWISSFKHILWLLNPWQDIYQNMRHFFTPTSETSGAFFPKPWYFLPLNLLSGLPLRG